MNTTNDGALNRSNLKTVKNLKKKNKKKHKKKIEYVINEKIFDADSQMTKEILKNVDNKSFFRNFELNISPKRNESCSFKNSAVELLCNSPIQDNIFKMNETDEIDEMEQVAVASVASEATKTAKASRNLYFICESDYCIGLFKCDSKAYICGNVTASVLHGEVRVHGRRLNERPQNVHSPRTSGLLSFHILEHRPVDPSLSSKLSDIGISPSNVRLAAKMAKKRFAVLLLRPLHDTVTDFILRHLPDINLFQDKNVCPTFHKKSHQLLKCSFYEEHNDTAPDELNFLSEKWISPYKNHLTNKITMICGGKGAGKSTALRYLVNKSLTHGPALVIDLDPGQPEFTVCGLLSATFVDEPLLGPNYTHLLQPDKSICLGLINVYQNENRYLNCVERLLKDCLNEKRFANAPWLINTMGYSDSLGLNLMASLMDLCKPNIVIEMMSSKSSSNFEMRLSSVNINSHTRDLTREQSIHNYDYYQIEPHRKNDFLTINHTEAKIQRFLNVLAYFSQMASSINCSILSSKPYAVPLNTVGLVFNNLQVDKVYIPSVLNGRLVALCKDNIPTNLTNVNMRTYNDDNPLECYGYGIIRGIDSAKNVAYILTPVKAENLSHVNVLMYSESLPDCCGILSLPHLPPNTLVPYAVQGDVRETSKHKHLHQIPKRRLNPLNLFKMVKKMKSSA